MANSFPNPKRRHGCEVTNRSVLRQDHITRTERYFSKALENSAQTVTEVNGMLTVVNLSTVHRKCRVRRRTELDEQELTTNKNKNHMQGGGRAPEERGVGMASLP